MTVDRFDEDRWDGYDLDWERPPYRAALNDGPYGDPQEVIPYTPVAVGHSYGDCTCETSAPDRDGNRDLLENPECPIHGPLG